MGTELGCLSGQALAAIATFPLFFAMVWGAAHCEPVPQCQNEGERWAMERLAYILGASVVLGISIRWLVNRRWGQRTGDLMPPAATQKAKMLAFAITAFAILAAYLVMRHFS